MSQNRSPYMDNHLNTETREPQIVLTENQVQIHNNLEEVKKSKMSSNTTIIGSTFLVCNMCLSTTLFSFGVRAKTFGLVWLIVASIIVGAINYWSLLRCSIASSRGKEDDYSEITEKLLGRKSRIILNIIVIIYSYACLMCFLSLIYNLFGRFILSVNFADKYTDYGEFLINLWGKAYTKYPFYCGLSLILSLISLNKDMKKFNYISYLGVAAVTYTLIVIAVQCHDYYQFYKNNKYVEEDENTHPNWINLGKAFTKKLDFFKGIATLFAAFSCHTGIFPIYSGFKYQENSIKKMKYTLFFATSLTIILYIICIVCSFLTEPVNPEDLIIYRKNKGNGKDIAMTISKLLIALSLFTTSPGFYFGLRLSIANSFTNGNISTKFNIILTFSTFYGCALVAALYDKILNYFSYIGGFISVFICYLFPALLYVYSSGKQICYWKNLLEIILAIFLCCIGVIAGIATIIDDFTR